MGGVAILGIFVADTSFRAARLPRMGETLLGEGFALGPGGKGSNQAVACGRLGVDVTLISRLGDDAFAAMAHETWRAAGVRPRVEVDPQSHTGAAFIFVDAASGDNAIIVTPGAAAALSAADAERERAAIEGADVFLTQLEQPLEAAAAGLRIARAAGTTTILNPAPAAPLPEEVLALCDWITPNESEAAELTGLAVTDDDSARAVAARLRATGAGGVVLTLGARGALVDDGRRAELVPAVTAGPVVETTGAGDAFNAGFATALSRGADPFAAARYGCAVAGLSVTRAGAAASMPWAREVADLAE